MAEPDDLRTAKDRGWRSLDEIDDALARGEIDHEGWHRLTTAQIEAAYLDADTPQGGSGHSGDDQRWERARRLMLDAVTGPGTFLDIGCANGLLMESVAAWSDGDLEPYGVDISVALAALARRRCPQWADRIWTANADGFDPGRRFTYVRTGLDYVPASRAPSYVARLLRLVEPGGRLVVGVFNEERDEDRLAGQVATWGFEVAGSTSREHRHPDLAYKAFWVAGLAGP
ncbi:MAG: class I SAM-dependent methyltransferase [Nocardioides sp.]|nr:class I SAM-dependent methyltransferase [Nocardioides sp.]